MLSEIPIPFDQNEFRRGMRGLLFMAQGFNGVHAGSLACREITEDHADRGGEEGDGHDIRFKHKGNGKEFCPNCSG